MSFIGFLNRSLTLLQAEALMAYEAVATTLGGRSVNVDVDGELVGMLIVRGRIVTGPPLAVPTTTARTSRAALARLLRGERDLTEAILADEITLIGDIENLTTLYDALLCYFRGAVRSPGFPALLDEFLGPPTRRHQPRLMSA